MEAILFKALTTLFRNYEQYGYYNEKEMFKVLSLIIIRDMLFFDFSGFLEERDIKHIEKAITCLRAESCMLAYELDRLNRRYKSYIAFCSLWRN